KNEEDEGMNLNSLYLTGSLPISSISTEAGVPKCKKIEIACESHDQGWSSYPRDHGTYNNSWTWDTDKHRTTHSKPELKRHIVNAGHP
ncbi:9449_t:CDS:2, partial [Gigaspora rosea]